MAVIAMMCFMLGNRRAEGGEKDEEGEGKAKAKFPILPTEKTLRMNT